LRKAGAFPNHSCQPLERYMDTDKVNFDNIRARTDAKLRYAKIYLDKLLSMDRHNGDDHERAHQESFLYHLLGAKEAFLQELNVYYSCALSQSSVSPGKLREELKNRGIKSKELSELYMLENDKTSWLYHAKEMRNHSTHISGVSRVFYAGGEDDGKVHFKDPSTFEEIHNHFADEFIQWYENMEKLLERLRVSAINKNYQ